MKNKENLLNIEKYKISIASGMILIGIGLGIFFWIFESVIHVFVFHEGNFTQQMFHPALHETWMRLIAISVIIIFGIYAQFANNKLKQEEDKVKYANTELNQIFDTAADGMRVIDKDFNIIRINKTLANLLDIKEDEAVGKKCYETFYGYPCHTPNCSMVQILNNKNRIETEVEKERPDGVKIPCIVTAIPFWGTNGEIIGIVEDFKDITERKRFEDALRESEDKYRTITSAANDAIIMMDNQGNISYWNPAAEIIFGYKREEALGKELHIFLSHKRYHQKYREGFSKFKETGEGPVIGKTLELSAIRKDNTEFPIELSLSAIKIRDKWHAAGIVRNISERKQAEKTLKRVKNELEKQNVELKKIDKIKDGLIRDVTHELKTPVAKHSMQLEILKEILQTHKLTDKAQNVVKIMEASIKRQEEVIRNILDLSRLEAGGRKYKIERVSIDKIIGKLVEDFQYATEIYGIQVKTNLEAVTVKSDGEMLSHVFSNIVNNAIKYRKRDIKAKIDIFCEKKGRKAIIKIVDNGIGLSEEEKEKAFDRFYQASPSAEGSGVGLTISKMIVEGLGGKISLESAGKGRGTTVIVQLPL